MTEETVTTEQDPKTLQDQMNAEFINAITNLGRGLDAVIGDNAEIKKVMLRISLLIDYLVIRVQEQGDDGKIDMRLEEFPAWAKEQADALIATAKEQEEAAATPAPEVALDLSDSDG